MSQNSDIANAARQLTRLEHKLQLHIENLQSLCNGDDGTSSPTGSSPRPEPAAGGAGSGIFTSGNRSVDMNSFSLPEDIVRLREKQASLVSRLERAEQPF